MYAAVINTTDVNELRFQLFCVKKGHIEASRLPPCRDCLTMHVMRANHQAGIWQRSLQPCPLVPNHSDHGWAVENGKLAVHWMNSPPAPDTVLELLANKCTQSCKLPNCFCLANGLSCTNMCSLQTCDNREQQDDLQIILG